MRFLCTGQYLLVTHFLPSRAGCSEWPMQNCAGGSWTVSLWKAVLSASWLLFPQSCGSAVFAPQTSVLPALLELVHISWVVCSQRTPRAPRGLTQSRDNSNRQRKPLPGSHLMEIYTAHCLGGRGCLCPTPETSGCGARKGSRTQITRAKT